MDTVTYQRRRALFLLYCLPGVVLASWVTRTPAIRDRLDASTAEMGIVLVGMSIGSMTGIFLSRMLVRRWGTRAVTLMGTIAMIAGVATVGVAAAIGISSVVFTGLALFGLGMGANEIALNVDGAEIERILDRPVLPTLHGCFSLGAAIGAVVGITLGLLNYSVTVHLLVVALVCAPAVVAVRAIPQGYGISRHRRARRRGRSRTDANPLREGRIVVLCLTVLAMALAEGAATDWLPLLMVDGHGVDPVAGSVVYAVFAASMAAGRFAGPIVLARFDRAAVVRLSALLGAGGLAVVIFSPGAVSAGISVVLWGLGTALGFPLAISAAGDGPGDRSAAVSAVATAGTSALLIGPPLLGFLGEQFTLRGAMIVVLALLVLAAAGASAMRPPTPVRSGGERRRIVAHETEPL
ncbi:MFS transporter [Rhodococcus sp. T2V]|uniref:MFS transporter n=1 Tax=Rhodococcus sp. T2V TaxID=3034164 RepID=UPI0023E1BB4C|nr:MFS transporter [Rhodococcus sp. T2V]MDF3307934.1 MFS transporter [Rhodococcus sp. T2V]